MTRILIMAASIGLSLSAAGACESMKSAEAKIDRTIVASVPADEEKKMSTPQQSIIIDEAATGRTGAEEAGQ